MRRLLVVDDEPHVLNALRRELHDTYEVETFASPTEALERSRARPFDLVITDYRMPTMNGIEFLKHFGEIQPDAARLLLSGHADSEVLMRAINETRVYRFLEKPWDAADLASSVARAIARRDVVLEYRRRAGDRKGGRATSEAYRTYRVILVADENGVLPALWEGVKQRGVDEGLLRALQREVAPDGPLMAEAVTFVTEIFTDPAAALMHAGGNDCDLAISAFKLSGNDGVEFMRGLCRIRPDTARILISTEPPDKETVRRAIADAQVHAFLHVSSWSAHEPRANLLRRMWHISQLGVATLQALSDRELVRRMHDRDSAGLG